MVSKLYEPGAPDVLYVVDVSGYVFRAYHAIAPLTSPSGEPTNAVLGTVNMLELLIKQRAPVLLAVAMDSGKQTFRRELYAEYKSHRPEAPPDLRSQMQRVEQVLQALAVPIFVQAGMEADDLIATLVAVARSRAMRVVIVSADKDLMPLVGPDVLLWDTMRDKVWGPEEVQERYGVRVDQLRDWLALTGDSSDNIPGVPSIGAKTAQQLLEEFGDIDAIYARLPEIKRQKLRDTLEAHREQAYLSRRLVTLKQDCEIDFDTTKMMRLTRDERRLREIYVELGFQRHIAALDARIAAAGAAAPPVSISSGGSPGAARSDDSGAAAAAPPTAQPESIEIVLRAEQLSSALEQAVREKRLVLAPVLQHTTAGEHLLGLALAVPPGTGYYVPLGHRYVGAPVQLPAQELAGALRQALGTSALRLGGHDVKAAQVALDASLNQWRPPGFHFAFDSLLAAYLIDSEAANTLSELADRELSLKLDALETMTKTATRGRHTPLDELEVERLGGLAARQALAVLRLWPVLERQLAELELMPLFTELELPLSEVLAELEERGVLCDVSVLGKLGASIDVRLSSLEREAQEIAGKPFNVHSPRQLETLLFDDLGLKPLKRTKTSRSTDAATLEALADAHALPAVVLEIRKLSKLKSTYIEALPGLVRRDTGRIHTRWGQATAATGRLASSDPNLQNIPIRSDLGREIRRAFVAPPGHELVSADYSQIELRVLAHLSKDQVLIDAFERGEDIHARTAREIFGLRPEDVTAEHRRRAKAVNFGVVYGQGEQGLSKSLGISRSEAGEFIAAYFRRYQGVREFMTATLDAARQTGQVRTLLGRLRRVPDIREAHHGRRAAAERIAMNTPIQGTAADLLKLAMLKLRDPVTPGCRMILTVHDELVFEVPVPELEAALPLIKQRMESIYSLAVPLVVDVGHAPAWDEAH